MSGHEQVVIALGWIGVAHQSAFGADRVKFLVASGDQFLRINLMTRVPDQPVLQKIIGAVQGQRQLDDTKVRRKVRRAHAEEITERFADFVGDLF